MGMYVMCQTHSGYKPLKFPRYRSGRTCRGRKWRFITLNHKWSVHDHPSLHSNGCHYKTFSFKASQRLWGCPTQHHLREPTQTRGPPVRECSGETGPVRTLLMPFPMMRESAWRHTGANDEPSFFAGLKSLPKPLQGRKHCCSASPCTPAEYYPLQRGECWEL